ncbi:hypothetical protein SO486_00755 [Pseudomonas salmasensis]|uniref:MotA/TolQ/ExbB proton channel domain-containing protein n=1 Tax=Pseudomonas salmasensis TaxID=2745514 RepID=A0ABU5FB44_9PSED|nr:hypothetical protein [Pseudomonas salmasensis]MDY4298525.1 hypothetical protein [Pseudomonas salmasensis]
MVYLIPCALILIIATSVGLGFLSTNWFLEFGLFTVVLSSFASMILAFLSGRKASRVRQVEYESYLPKMDEKESHFFKFSVGIMGANNQQPLVHLQNQIDEIKRVAIQDEKSFRSLSKITNYRVSIALAQIKFHEEVTLPKILGAGSGSIILAGVMTIIGSAYLAFPGPLYERFFEVASALKGMFGSLLVS